MSHVESYLHIIRSLIFLTSISCFAAAEEDHTDTMSVKVKVRRVVEHPKVGVPILVDFEHAGVNKNVDIRTRLVGELYESSEAEVSQHPQLVNSLRRGEEGLRPRKRKQVVVVQGETDMTYIGASDGPLNTNFGGLRTFLAVRHKSKLKIYEATRITVSPYIGNRAHLIVQDTKKPENAEEAKKAAAGLVKAFGSKKKQLSYERHEKNIIDSEHMNESINTATESATVSAIPLNLSDTSFVNLLPPCNRETKDVKSVYALHDILTDDDMGKLQEMALGWLNCTQEQIKEWKAAKRYRPRNINLRFNSLRTPNSNLNHVSLFLNFRFSDYFYEMHRKLSPRKDSASSIYTAKLVLYAELLICILRLKFGDLRRKIVPLPAEFEGWLVSKALSNFTEVNANKIR